MLRESELFNRQISECIGALQLAPPLKDQNFRNRDDSPIRQ